MPASTSTSASTEQPQQNPASTSTSISLTTTLILTVLLLISFFPAVFHHLWTVPLSLLLGSASASASTSSSKQASKYTSTSSMSWTQKTLSLPARSRGSYLITDDIVAQLPELKNYKVGLLHLFIQHTSCALSLNENWDADVREDMSDALDRIAPEDRKGVLYRHSAEGLDDMPAHIKSALVGASVSVPITNGRLATGTWQGVWFLEFRASKHTRKVVATIQGEKA